jgi:hypothetical protein
MPSLRFSYTFYSFSVRVGLAITLKMRELAVCTWGLKRDVDTSLYFLETMGLRASPSQAKMVRM